MLKTILLIQEDTLCARAVQEVLLGSGDPTLGIEWVRGCSEGLERLNRTGKQKSCIDAVLVDLFLPDSQGIETFERLYKELPDTPILVLCGPEEEHIAKLAVQLGAQDYLLKNRLDSDVLLKARRTMIERAANAEALF